MRCRPFPVPSPLGPRSRLTAAVRSRIPDRTRIAAVSLDEQLPADHPARLLGDFVPRLDLSAFVRPRKAVAGHPGPDVLPATRLFALGLFALTAGSRSARRLAVLGTRDLPYPWLCGGRPVNYHTRADCEADHGGAWRAVFGAHGAALPAPERIDLGQVTRDGRQVRAHAAQDSFRRAPTLQAHRAEARAPPERLEAEAAEEAAGARQAAARRRAARQRQRRLEAAVAQGQRRPDARGQAQRTDCDPAQARASETDPDAAQMKRSAGGDRPASTGATVAAESSGLIGTVAVSNQGSDNGRLGPRRAQGEQEPQTLPGVARVDSGFADQQDLERAERAGVRVLRPPRDLRRDQPAGRDPYRRQRRDSDGVAAGRARMGTAAAQRQYRRRGPVAEGVQAQQANRGWQRFRRRGLAQVQTEAWWQARAPNGARLLAWGVALAGTGRAAAA
jgi:transposase